MPNDFGLRIAQKGYDVKTCEDFHLAFSSSWPLLKIHETGTFTIPDATLDVTIATHNLGYTPLFWVFVNSQYVDAAYYPVGGSRIAEPGANQFLAMNATDLKWQGASRGASAGVVTGRYYIFRYDNQTTFTAPIVNTATVSAGSVVNDYGFKVAKQGKSINSTDLRDYVIHSGTRSPMVHMTGHGSFGGGGGTITVTHDLGYLPLYFTWAKITAFGDSRWQQVLSADDASVTATTTTITFALPYACDYSYLIMKDPLLLN